MIHEFFSCLLYSTIEIRILWLISFLFLTFHLGYQTAKKRYSRLNSGTFEMRSQCIVPYA